MRTSKKYDVIILGGGLAGLTLALHLKQSRSDISILVLEKRKHRAPEAIHKVGESTSELGSFYLREVLHLKEYLNEYQLPKFGFRFFFSPEHSDDISKRVEVGSRISNPFPTHQIDRGIFENYLVDLLISRHVDFRLGAKVLNVELSKEGHTIDFELAGNKHQEEGKWVIDSTGRSSLLKRMLGLTRGSDHTINAAWFRIHADVNIDDWSDNPIWRSYVEPGRRRLATNHLMGEGYWVWIIPLVSGCTSFGIVADPRYHPFEAFSTFEKALQWLKRYEPLAAQVIGRHRERLMDFKVMRNFAHECKQFYSVDRWAVTGDAGTFLDPFYSPGTDFIALGNTWLTDLVIRDLNGEDILLRTMIYEHTHRELLKGWTKLYQDMYGVFGKTQIMLMKIVWDWASYWAVPNVLFTSNGYTSIPILKQYSASADSIGPRFARLNERMQELFRMWNTADSSRFAGTYHNVFDLNCLLQFQLELSNRYNPEELMEKVRANLQILELIAAEIFRRVSCQMNETPEDMRIDPYTMSIDDGKDELLKKSKDPNAFNAVESIKADISKMWLKEVRAKSNEYAE